MYEPGGIDIRGRETEGDLVALCRQCHFQRHIDPAGEFWRDPEEMEHYWSAYHEEAEK